MIHSILPVQLTCLTVFLHNLSSELGQQGSLALAGSLSRRRKTLIQNRGWRSPLASPCDGRTHQSSRIFRAIGFWVCFVGDVGRRGVTSSHVKNLTAQTWWSTMTASHSSFIEVPSTTSLQEVSRTLICSVYLLEFLSISTTDVILQNEKQWIQLQLRKTQLYKVNICL